MKIGCHISIQGGIEYSCQRADELCCETFQIFTQNQRQWISKLYDKDDVKSFQDARDKYGYADAEIISHASYLINLCASDPKKLKQSRQAFLEELKRCDLLGIHDVVIHPGVHGGSGEKWGIATIAESINIILELYQPKTKILLETIAGQGTGIGYKFEHLHDILQKIVCKEHVSLCLDTCHIFAAGYSIRDQAEWNSVLEQIDSTFGIDKIEAIHLNDCKFTCGSKKDRHAEIGEGYIGLEGFECLVNMKELNDVPAILEVPGGDEVFKDNIALLKAMRK